jgi:hypothetical protein
VITHFSGKQHKDKERRLGRGMQQQLGRGMQQQLGHGRQRRLVHDILHKLELKKGKF